MRREFSATEEVVSLVGKIRDLGDKIYGGLFYDSSFLIAWSWVDGVRRRGLVVDCSGASKPGEKWRHFQRHLVARRGDGQSHGLDQFHMVIPGIELDASAQRRRCDLVQFVVGRSASTGLTFAEHWGQK